MPDTNDTPTNPLRSNALVLVRLADMTLKDVRHAFDRQDVQQASALLLCALYDARALLAVKATRIVAETFHCRDNVHHCQGLCQVMLGLGNLDPGVAGSASRIHLSASVEPVPPKK